jgi:alpha-beta hydrolase superfamily lysophospholipase
MKHIESTFQGADGLDLYCQYWRPEGETRAVLAIVHGFGEHSGRYANVVSHLVPRGFAIYGFDLRGHGRSAGERGHINAWGEYREDVRAFLEFVRHEKPDRQRFLMGHSLGGLIVLEFVLHGAEGLRGLIASAPVLVQPEISPIVMTLSPIFSRILPRLSMEAKLDASTLSRDPELVAAYQDDALVHSKGSARLGSEMGRAIAWTHAHAQDLRVPLLILHGQADKLVSPEGSRVFYKNVTLSDKQYHEYEGGYHEPHNDIDHERVMKDLAGWLEKHL